MVARSVFISLLTLFLVGCKQDPGLKRIQEEEVLIGAHPNKIMLYPDGEKACFLSRDVLFMYDANTGALMHHVNIQHLSADSIRNSVYPETITSIEEDINKEMGIPNFRISPITQIWIENTSVLNLALEVYTTDKSTPGITYIEYIPIILKFNTALDLIEANAVQWNSLPDSAYLSPAMGNAFLNDAYYSNLALVNASNQVRLGIFEHNQSSYKLKNIVTEKDLERITYFNDIGNSSCILAMENGKLGILNLKDHNIDKLTQVSDLGIQSVSNYNDTIACIGVEKSTKRYVLHWYDKELNHLDQVILPVTLFSDKSIIACGLEGNKLFLMLMDSNENYWIYLVTMNAKGLKSWVDKAT